jgi:hypothetical protein
MIIPLVERQVRGRGVAAVDVDGVGEAPLAEDARHRLQLLQVRDRLLGPVAQREERGVRRDDAVGARGRIGLGGPPGAAREAAIDERAVLVRRIAAQVHPERVDAARVVSALGHGRRREAPRAVAGGHEPVVDLGVDRRWVVLAPRARAPDLGHEQRRHQRLEHRAAPARRHARVAVRVGAVEHVDAEVGAMEAHRPRLLPRPKVNPGGKLPASFPYRVGQVPIYYNHEQTGRPCNKQVKWNSQHRDIPSCGPLFDFGFGLSYTTSRSPTCS